MLCFRFYSGHAKPDLCVGGAAGCGLLAEEALEIKSEQLRDPSPVGFKTGGEASLPVPDRRLACGRIRGMGAPVFLDLQIS
jgi:hypothetical protein